MFAAFYESPWQHPLLLLALPLASLFFLPRRRGFFPAYLWFFTCETMLDALLTSPFAPGLGVSETLGSTVAITFVLLGDYRLFLLVERYRLPAESRRISWFTALGLTLIVPLLQAGLLRAFPDFFAETRRTFLVYELCFVSLALGYRLFVGRTADEPLRAWLSGLVHFALGYYALWALADVLILSGFDAGFGLRVLPNLLYYGAFLPFALGSAPAGEPERARAEVRP